MFFIEFGLGFCAGAAAVLGIQALVEHKRYTATAREDFIATREEIKQITAEALTEIRRLTGPLS